jgi:two-component system NtrC family sensor kinase
MTQEKDRSAMATTAFLSPQIQVLGVPFLAFRQVMSGFHLLCAPELEAFLQQVRYNAWYPAAPMLQLFQYLVTYADPGPILEQIGMELAQLLSGYDEWQAVFRSGEDFLRAHQDSRLYYTFVKGPRALIGAFSLRTIDVAAGRASLHSSTPFRRELERGFILGGLRLTHSFAYIQIDNSQDAHNFQIDLVRANDAPSGVATPLGAQEFLSALRLTGNRALAGVELHTVFWRYKTQEQELARQQRLWTAAQAALGETLQRLREQESLRQEHHNRLLQAHATSETLRAGIIDAALDAIITINEASEIVEFNAGAERIFGYARARVLGQRITEVIVPPHLRQRHHHGMQRYVQTGKAGILGQRIEIDAMHADGHIFPVELAVQEVRLGQQRLFTAYLRDITERVRMERALRESEQRFRSLVEVNPVPLGIAAIADSRWLYVSPSLARLVGTSVAELQGSAVEDLYADPAMRQVLRARLLAEGSVPAYEFMLRKKDGTAVPVALTATRIVYDGTDAILGGIMDLTALKRAEEEIARQREALYQSEKLSALGSLLAGVAHELNNPLSVVIGRAIMLEEETHDPETAATATRIRQAAERCTRIVKTFLAMARQQQPESTVVNLNTLIPTALELVGYGLRTAGIAVRLDLAADLPDLLADATQLHQVFTNLMINAQQALIEVPEPRWLHIATRYDQTAHGLQVTVTDNGPGVPAPIRSRIFDPFFTTKPMGIGTGVGLSLSHGIITAHGGTLFLENPSGGGARFVITLPLAVPPPVTVEEVPGAHPAHTARTILIVDDEPEVAEMLRDLLQRAGHMPTVVHSGRAALAHLAAGAFDLVLSDVHMPELNGLELYRHIQTTYPSLRQRLILITGDTLGTTVQNFLATTQVPYLEKPFVPRDVLDLVQRLLP